MSGWFDFLSSGDGLCVCFRYVDAGGRMEIFVSVPPPLRGGVRFGRLTPVADATPVVDTTG